MTEDEKLIRELEGDVKWGFDRLKGLQVELEKVFERLMLTVERLQKVKNDNRDA